MIRPSSANGGFSREQMPPVDMNRKMNFRLIFFMRGSPKKDAGDTWPFPQRKRPKKLGLLSPISEPGHAQDHGESGTVVLSCIGPGTEKMDLEVG